MPVVQKGLHTACYKMQKCVNPAALVPYLTLHTDNVIENRFV